MVRECNKRGGTEPGHRATEAPLRAKRAGRPPVQAASSELEAAQGSRSLPPPRLPQPGHPSWLARRSIINANSTSWALGGTIVCALEAPARGCTRGATTLWPVWPVSEIAAANGYWRNCVLTLDAGMRAAHMPVHWPYGDPVWRRVRRSCNPRSDSSPWGSRGGPRGDRVAQIFCAPLEVPRPLMRASGRDSVLRPASAASRGHHGRHAMLMAAAGGPQASTAWRTREHGPSLIDIGECPACPAS